MRHWLPRSAVTRLCLDRRHRANIAPLAPRLMVGAMVAILFGVDSARPVIHLSDKTQQVSRSSKPGAKPHASEPARKNPPAAPLVWTTPWIPPYAEVGAGVSLELVLRAAPSSIRPASQVSFGSVPVWKVPEIADAWQAQFAPTNIRLISAVKPIPFSLLSCCQICPVGPPAV